MTPIILLAVAQAVPTPPPVMISMAPPATRPQPPASGPVTTISLDVDVRAGGEPLWKGEMIVADRQQADFSRRQTNAARPPCPNAQSGFDVGDRSSLTVTASMANRDGAFRFSINWERPGDRATCSSGRSTRMVAVSETILLQPGGEQTIQGDGGLTVKVRRH